ncbi:MAG: TRC40/GET3/ArsA family transport-energizing ATPase [Aquificae bacterium]|nr:TRC40/GET3/ArsA family transport-energizing ATPase [Aquificota bacterium]
MRVFFLGGKGGVGKTTLACALALRLPPPVLLLSTDPAHSLADALPDPPEHITLKQLDPRAEMESYKRKLLALSSAFLSQEALRRMESLVRSLEESPGIEDVLIFEALTRELTQNNGLYENVVVDTAPTGHTLGLLKTVKNIGDLLTEVINIKEKIEKLRSYAKSKKHEQALKVLKERNERFEKFAKIVRERSAFLPVLTPDKLSLLETKRLLHSLQHFGIKVNTLIVNKVLPKSSNDPYLEKLAKQQDKYIKEIREAFPNKKVITIPMLEEEPVGRERLRTLSALLRL